MIFRNKYIAKNKNDYLFVGDIIDTDIETIEKEFLENKPILQRGKVIIGTFGTFSIKEFKKAVGGLKDV